MARHDAGMVDAERLKSLLAELRLSLEASVADSPEDAEALAIATTQLVEAAVVERPNRSLISGAVQAVLSGGKSLLAASPKIATTVNQIIDTVQKIQELSDG